MADGSTGRWRPSRTLLAVLVGTGVLIPVAAGGIDALVARPSPDRLTSAVSTGLAVFVVVIAVGGVGLWLLLTRLPADRAARDRRRRRRDVLRQLRRGEPVEGSDWSVAVDVMAAHRRERWFPVGYSVFALLQLLSAIGESASSLWVHLAFGVLLEFGVVWWVVDRRRIQRGFDRQPERRVVG